MVGDRRQTWKMVGGKQLSPAAFKARVRGAAEGLCLKAPDGWMIDALGEALDPENYGPGASGRQALRRALEHLTKSGVLSRKAEGSYAGGPNIGAVVTHGAPERTRQDLLKVMHDLGGVARRKDLVAALGGDGLDASLVDRVLRDSPDFVASSWNLGGQEGYGGVWMLAEPQRQLLPLPGRWLSLELRMVMAAMGRETSGGVLPERERRINAVLAGVREARLIMRYGIDDLVSAPALAGSLSQAFENARGITLPDSAHGGRLVTVANLWGRLQGDRGESGALVWMWEAMEAGGDYRDLVLAFSADVWRAFAAMGGLNPAMLSRGALTPALTH